MSHDALNYTLGFTLSGPWGHFRKPEGTISRMTYKVPPRTTIAGMVAGIVGKSRDSYYDEYSCENLSVSIVPQSNIKTQTIPENVMGTASENMENINSRGRGPKLSVPDPKDNRKQRVFEFLHDPSYRVYLSFKDEQSYDEVKEVLRAGKSEYTPTLGISECVARIDEESVATELQPEEKDSSSVHSTVPSVKSIKPTSDVNLANERAPLDMTKATGTTGRTLRKTNAFVNYVVNTKPNTGPIQIVDDASLNVYEVESNRVCFL